MVWGIIAASIAFWINSLLKEAIPQKTFDLLVVPIVEEIAKYLGIRQTRSVVTPLTFMVCEAVIQMSTTIFMIKAPMTMLLFAILIGIISLKHVLFYCINKLTGFKVYGVLLAIAAHSFWNWYVVSENDTLQVGVIALLVILLPAFAVWKDGERNVRDEQVQRINGKKGKKYHRSTRADKKSAWRRY